MSDFNPSNKEIQEVKAKIPRRTAKSVIQPGTTHTVFATKYTEEIAGEILKDIANTPDSIETICKKHGIVCKTWYNWISSNREYGINGDRAPLLQWHMRALGYQAVAKFGDIATKQDEIDQIIDNPDIPYRDKDIAIRWFQARSKANEFYIKKANPRLFGDRIEVESTHTIKPADAREQAWKLTQQALHEVVEPVQLPAPEQDIE